MQKSKIKVQDCGFGLWPKLFYAKESKRTQAIGVVIKFI